MAQYTTPEEILVGVLARDIRKIVVTNHRGTETTFTDFIVQRKWNDADYNFLVLRDGEASVGLDFGNPEKFTHLEKNKFKYVIDNTLELILVLK